MKNNNERATLQNELEGLRRAYNDLIIVEDYSTALDLQTEISNKLLEIEVLEDVILSADEEENNNERVCSYCGNVLDADEECRSNNDYDCICEACQDEFYYCADCNKYLHNDDMTYLEEGDKIVCQNCLQANYTECYECNNMIADSEIFRTADHREVCRDCYYDLEGCAECGDRFYDSDNHLEYSELMDCWLCADCRPNEGNRDAVLDYNYKPIPIFYKTATDSAEPRFYGLENEAQKGGQSDSNAQYIMSQNEELYVKYDSTLSRGFEIVSHPCTLDYHTNNLDWDTLLRWLRNKDYESGKGAGLHIHTGKKGLNDLAQSKIAYLANVKSNFKSKTRFR